MKTSQSSITDSRSAFGKHFWLEWLVVVAVTVIAVFLRFYKVAQVPPGFNSDEAVGAVGALETLRSGLRLYYSGQGGGGSLGFYVAALSFALFGPSVATIRGTAAFAGVVSVIATYFATREMFRPTTGLSRARLLAALATVGLGTSLWHAQSSRVAFAAIGVPFLQVPGNYFLWRGLNTGRRSHFVVSGVFLASLMYIYLSGSFGPFVYLFFFLIQWLMMALMPTKDEPSLLKKHFWNLAICAGVAFVLFVPMLYFYLTAPELATERARQALFTNPLINKGDPWGTLWRSLGGNIAAFGFSLSWIRGVPPPNLLLPVPVALLFLIGFFISLWRVRQPPYLFMVLYWAIMLVPSILSPDAIPHTLRAVGASPAVYMLVAVGAMAIVDLGLRVAAWASERFEFKFEMSKLQIAVTALILLALGIGAALPLSEDYVFYFTEWPKINDVQAAYHVYAVELAEDMSQEDNPQATFLLPRDTAAGDVNPNYTVEFLYRGEAGYAWVVDDEDTLELTLNEAVQGRDVVHVIQWKASKHTGADPKEIIRYYLEKHGAFVEERAFEYYDIQTFQLDRPGPDLTDEPLTSTSVDFGGQLALVGYAFGDASGASPVDAASAPAGDLLWVRLRFRPVAIPTAEDLKASVIVSDGAGHVVGQIDKLLVNNVFHQGSSGWRPDKDTEVDAYYLIPVAPAAPPGEYQLRVAVYGAQSLTRLSTPEGDSTQKVTLGTVAIRPDLSAPDVESLGLAQVLELPVSDELTLLGTASIPETLRPGDRAQLTLVWRAQEAPSEDYQASLWLVRGEDAWPLTDSLPLAGVDYPSSNWSAGQVVRGWFDAHLPPDIPSGDYGLGVRVTFPDGEPLAEVPLGMLVAQGWPRQFEVPSVQHPMTANFDNQIELLGYDLATPDATSGTLSAVLYWRALSEMDVSYTTFIHLLDESGRVVSQVDHVPGDGSFPTSGWLAGEVIADQFALPLQGIESPDSIQVEIGIYDPTTGDRLPVIDENGNAIDTRVLLPVNQ